MGSQYTGMLKLAQLPREEFLLLKGLVKKYDIAGSPSQAYSDIFGALIRLAVDIGGMENGIINNGEEYIRRHVADYYEGVNTPQQG